MHTGFGTGVLRDNKSLYFFKSKGGLFREYKQKFAFFGKGRPFFSKFNVHGCEQTPSLMKLKTQHV
jgi:hypothetical protein